MSDFLSQKEALSCVSRLCAGSEKCEADILMKLQRINSNPAEADAIIEYLRANDFINENRYAECFVRDKFKFNKWGKIKIKAELRHKRIPEKIIEKALCQIDPLSYEETLRRILLKKKASLKVTEDNQLKIKLIRHASGKGYEQEITQNILDEILKEKR